LRRTAGRNARFVCSTALLGIVGFLGAGMCDYTYGHALGLTLISFVAITPLCIFAYQRQTSAESVA
jgi:hypothetical protein